MDMPALNFPTYSFKIKETNGKSHIFDPIRKKHLVLTPEEWVRQHIVQFLIQEKNCPRGLIGLEKGLKVNDLHRRTDVVVYQKTGAPCLIVECKAPSVKITQKAFDQIAQYNFTLQVSYLLVTNGLQHYCCCVDLENKTVAYLGDLPEYKELRIRS